MILLSGLVAHPALADADYPVYACDGPFLRMVSAGGLSPEEVAEQFPDLPAPAEMEFYILQEGETAHWTDMTRDALREMCLARVDAVNKPWNGLWLARVAPHDPDLCTAPPPVELMIGAFPRVLRFEGAFHPAAILDTASVPWEIDRYPEDLMWSAFAGLNQGLTSYRGLAVTFLEVTPQIIEIDLYVETLEKCYSNYAVTLMLDGY